MNANDEKNDKKLDDNQIVNDNEEVNSVSNDVVDSSKPKEKNELLNSILLTISVGLGGFFSSYEMLFGTSSNQFNNELETVIIIIFKGFIGIIIFAGTCVSILTIWIAYFTKLINKKASPRTKNILRALAIIILVIFFLKWFFDV